jgi:penicillin-binding protein 1A
MNVIMNKVVEEGTGKRAILEGGIKAAGKTGTTNAYRDAWFMGFTGNYVCGVWVGNDDYAPTKRMTGGSLPAMTWHDIMAYAHQGIELKNIPGVAPGSTPASAPAVAEAAGGGEVAPRPALLTRRAAAVLTRVERLMEDATRALASTPATPVGSGASLRQPGPVAATEGGAVRGN